MILAASRRATELICEVAGATSAATIGVAGELPPDPPDVSLRYERLDQLVGIHIEPATADAILTRFSLAKSDSASRPHWKIPSYRRDLQREVDLIEEIIRAHGIEKIPSADRSRFTSLSEADRNFDIETKLRRDLIAIGLTEARTSSLIARSEIFGPGRNESLYLKSATPLRHLPAKNNANWRSRSAVRPRRPKTGVVQKNGSLIFLI